MRASSDFEYKYDYSKESEKSQKCFIQLECLKQQQYLLNVIPDPHAILAHSHDIFLQHWCMQSRAATTTLQGEPNCMSPHPPMRTHLTYIKQYSYNQTCMILRSQSSQPCTYCMSTIPSSIFLCSSSVYITIEYQKPPLDKNHYGGSLKAQ